MHHVIVFMQEPGQTGRAEGNLLTGTAPGEPPVVYSEGFGKKIVAGTKFVFQMHYTPNGVATKDVTSVGLIFAKTQVKHQLFTRPILNNRFVIPAGAAAHEVKSTFTFQQPVRVVGFMPHMHLRGKDFIYTAVSPEGKETYCSQYRSMTSTGRTTTFRSNLSRAKGHPDRLAWRTSTIRPPTSTIRTQRRKFAGEIRPGKR